MGEGEGRSQHYSAIIHTLGYKNKKMVGSAAIDRKVCGGSSTVMFMPLNMGGGGQKEKWREKNPSVWLNHKPQF